LLQQIAGRHARVRIPLLIAGANFAAHWQDAAATCAGSARVAACPCRIAARLAGSAILDVITATSTDHRAWRQLRLGAPDKCEHADQNDNNTLHDTPRSR